MVSCGNVRLHHRGSAATLTAAVLSLLRPTYRFRFSRRATPLMKLGLRIIAGIQGSMWQGVELKYLMRSVFNDTQHGSSMQAATVLMNLCAQSQLEGYLPEQFWISCDNTSKESKNSVFACFICWLLCQLSGSRLKTIRLSYLMVGHTHDALV